MTIEDALAEAKRQIEKGCTNAYGEPQAIIALENDRVIEIVYEEDGLPDEDKFYSITLHCASVEYDSFEDTNGIMSVWESDAKKLDEIRDRLQIALDYNNTEVIRSIDFTGCLQNAEQVSLGDGFIDMTLKMEGKAFEALVYKLDLLTVTGGTLEELINYYDINITAAMDVGDSNSMRVVASIANDSEGVYDVDYELVDDEYMSLCDEIAAHAERNGYTIDEYIEMAETEGACVIVGQDDLRDELRECRSQDALEH